MTKLTGAALALAALLTGGFFFGWQGVILAMTGIIFALLLQFTRLMKLMRSASEAPVGHVDSAVMLNARMREGLRLVDVIPLTHSLGEKLPVAAPEEGYVWTDQGGSRVELVFEGGKLKRWQLHRPTEDAS